MDSLQLREIMIEMGKNLKCPKCARALSSTHLGIEGSQTDQFEFSIKCPDCKENFPGYAQLSPAVSNKGKMMNASSVLIKDQVSGRPMQESDVSGVHKALAGSVNFTQMFGKKQPQIVNGEAIVAKIVEAIEQKFLK